MNTPDLVDSLIEALAEAFLFLESADDSEVDPDLAVRTMENMTWHIHKLSTADHIALRKRMEHKFADDDILKELPHNMDLAQ